MAMLELELNRMLTAPLLSQRLGLRGLNSMRM
jgi:hypothetical protein